MEEERDKASWGPRDGGLGCLNGGLEDWGLGTGTFGKDGRKGILSCSIRHCSVRVRCPKGEDEEDVTLDPRVFVLVFVLSPSGNR